MPVDLYVGGAEHAVLHLLYSRFWHKVLFDLGHVSTPEPFMRLVNQGMILGEDGQKMSKSRGNVINPDDVVREYGADAFRMYEMFMGPLEATKPWNTQGLEGVYRFLGRVWRLFCDEDGKLIVDDSEPDPKLLKVLHHTIKKVGEDTDTLAFNTAVSTMMEFVNAVTAQESRPRKLLEPFVLVLAPYAPHLAEELWEKLGHKQSLAYEPWPKYDAALLKENSVTIILQVNGKLRDRVDVPHEHFASRDWKNSRWPTTASRNFSRANKCARSLSCRASSSTWSLVDVLERNWLWRLRSWLILRRGMRVRSTCSS